MSNGRLVSSSCAYLDIDINEVQFGTLTCKGDLVVSSDKLQSPVVLSIARGREVGCAIHETVGDSDVSIGFVAKDVVYTASVLSLVTIKLEFSQGVVVESLTNRNMVNPDLRSARECDSIATPDKFRVEVGDHDVLDDDVGGTDDSQSFAEEYALVSDSDDRLV